MKTGPLRPNLDASGGGVVGWFKIADADAAQLRNLLPRRGVTDAQRDAFMASLPLALERWHDEQRETETLSETLRVLEDVQQAAVGMRTALRALEPHRDRVGPAWLDMLWSTDPGVPVPPLLRELRPEMGEALDYVVQACELLQLLPPRAREYLQAPAGHRRPGDATKRALVRAAALAWRDACGELPPSSRQGWFYGFMQEVARVAGVDPGGGPDRARIGHHALARALDSLRAQPT